MSICKKIAIAADNPEVYSQTFVLRHINELANGNTALILTKKRKVKSIKKPIFIYQRRFSLIDKINKIFNNILKLKIQSDKEHKDENIQIFIDKYQIGAVLAEFGYVGVVLYSSIVNHKIPFYCYFRGSDASRKLKDPNYVSRLKEMMPKINGIFAVSQSLLNNLKDYGIEHPNSFVIPSGVDAKLFKPAQMKDNNLIIAVGRFVEKKSPATTISAFSVISKIHPNVRLEMVGDGELLEECKILAERLGVRNKIIFHGAKNHEFIKDLMGRASFFMQHSITSNNGDTEGMPTAIQEAMSSGCVVVTTYHAGIPEHIQTGLNGMLVNEGDINAYIQALDRVIRDPLMTHSLSVNAREYAIKNFDYKKNYRKITKIILDRSLN